MLRDLSQSSPRSEADRGFTYADCDISEVSGSLQVPWAVDKGTTFAYRATYMGFYWDLQSYWVGIPEDKSAKYRAAITVFLHRHPHNLEQVQSLYGKLVHCTHIIPCGRAYLTGLEQTMALLSAKPFRPVHPARSVDHDLAWWLQRLQSPCIERSVLLIENVVDIGAFSDASSGIGVGIIVSGEWDAWYPLLIPFSVICSPCFSSAFLLILFCLTLQLIRFSFSFFP